MSEDLKGAKLARRTVLIIMLGLAAVLVFSPSAAKGAMLVEVSQPDGPTVQTGPVDGDAIGEGPVAFYDFRSDSAHTGFEVARQSVLFMYEYADNLSLFTVHNRDSAGGSGSSTQDISGLPAGWIHQQRDDSGSGGTQDTYTAGANSLLGEWRWNNNSDGSALGLGAVAELMGTEIVVAPSNWSNVDLWSFLGPDGVSALPLDMDKAVHIRLIPEPATLSLLALAGLAGLRPRRR